MLCWIVLLHCPYNSWTLSIDPTMYVAVPHVCWITFGLIHTLDKLGISEAKKTQGSKSISIPFIRVARIILGYIFSKFLLEFSKISEKKKKRILHSFHYKQTHYSCAYDSTNTFMCLSSNKDINYKYILISWRMFSSVISMWFFAFWW